MVGMVVAIGDSLPDIVHVQAILGQDILLEWQEGLGEFVVGVAAPVHGLLVDGQVYHVLHILHSDHLVLLHVLLEEVLHPIPHLGREQGLVQLHLVLAEGHPILDCPKLYNYIRYM